MNPETLHGTGSALAAGLGVLAMSLPPATKSASPSALSGGTIVDFDVTRVEVR